MGGIAGIAGDMDALESRLHAMLHVQQHRGKGGGLYVAPFVDARIGLGHNGLSVGAVDGNIPQPFVDSAVSLVVAMDGELYNCRELRGILSHYYTFETDATVEIVAKAFRHWGRDALLRFEGVFALAIYDILADTLLLARDKFGVRPLYYATNRGRLLFASEVHAIFAAGLRRQLSVSRWAGYMVYSSYGLPYETFWDGVHQLPAGFMLCYNGYSLYERGWYKLQDEIENLRHEKEAGLKELFGHEMERCAERSLSDVSICGFRIGDRVESQLLYGLAVHGIYADKVFPLREFPGEDTACEQREGWTVTTTRRAIAELERMPEWIEEPFDGVESIVRSILFRRASANNMNMLCSGVGLDVMWQDEWDKSEVQYDYCQVASLFAPEFAALARRPSYSHPFDDDAANMRYLDLYNERLPHILRFFDRSAADAGVQLRMPFLASVLVALSFVLPEVSHRVRRELFDDYTVQRYAVRYGRRKALPIWSAWLDGGLREWMADSLSDLRSSSAREWFNVKELTHMQSDVVAKSPVDVALLWKCLALHRMLVAVSD